MSNASVTRDLYRHLLKQGLSEAVVMARSLKSAKAAWRSVRAELGLGGTPRITTEPNGSAKAEHGLSDVIPAAVWMVYLLPSDASGEWQVCRYATAGCRAACLAESGQAGMETNSGKGTTGHIHRARLARTLLLGRDPIAFFRLLVSELDRIPSSAWATKGFALGFRANGTSDLPLEHVVPWLFERLVAAGVQPYDYTAWPTSRRDRSSIVHLVDSVKETHTDRAVDRMARPVVVFNVARGRALPTTWRGRRVVDADLSDARWLDPVGTVAGLRYKHVASTTAAAALASGFVRSAS